jgi:hypothetical protein
MDFLSSAHAADRNAGRRHLRDFDAHPPFQVEPISAALQVLQKYFCRVAMIHFIYFLLYQMSGTGKGQGSKSCHQSRTGGNLTMRTPNELPQWDGNALENGTRNKQKPFL